ncbi:unnamed protein product (macronuclear) [Paramecium tetraurelia]|uniref:Transmembrane protein n=1 Tax=Paramecium tetraurelia TaxID=5888 RepID=A0EC24_PARTE|nr:uncharacterized protein GSPATT00025577001 [Paramecium tetraurelia]CAK92841.1 unnamed protein product [Paramecium tetraurelia]|eukprot:XP_001460238.1 hypothetical protein (macronuclear) [Paramecium tetraurelia strain d4-2]
MNFLSLSFADKVIETKYQNRKKELSQQLLKFQQALVILMLLYVLISSAFKQIWISLCISGIGLILLIISVKLNIDRQEQRYLNNTIIIFMTVFNYYKSLHKILNETLHQISYIEGYMLALATTSCKFYVKMLYPCFNLHSATNLSTYVDGGNMGTDDYILGVFNTTPDLSIQNRLAKHQKAEQQLVNLCGITLYIVSYKRDTNQMLLTTYNNEDNITIQQQQQFVSQIRNMRVLIKDQESRTHYKSEEEIKQDAKMNLEKFLFYFVSCPEKLKDYMNKFQVDSLIKLQGVQNQENYNISIIKYFDQLPSAIILISQNKKDVFIEELKLRYKIFQQVMETIDEIFQSQVKMSLIYFRGIHKYQKVKSNNNMDLCIYQKIQSKIAKAYNDFQNIKDFFNLNTSFQRSIIQKFNFITFLEDILIEIQHYFYQSKKFTYSITNQLKKDNVFQDQKQLKQLFLNLLYYLTEHCQEIGIVLDQGEEYSLKKPYFRVKIEFKGTSFSKDAIKGLPFINPITLSELRHNAEQVYQLNLPMAIVIVRKLGPTNKIHIKQNKNGVNSIEFLIFRELSEDFHLMPMKSQHPSNYLILNARSSIHGKHAAYFDLLSLSPRIQLDNFGEL